MKRFKLFMLLISVCLCNITVAQKYDWKLGVQTFTFHKFTFVETLDKTESLGIKYAEIYYGQPLGEGFDNLKMDYNMPKTAKEKVLSMAKSKNVKIIASGVAMCDTQEEWAQLFAFAKEMGIKIITCEPKSEHLDAVEKLADKYKIDVAIHNHPQPSDYWSPDLVMKALEGRSKRMGVCADVGHWKREGIDPVKALQQTAGRLKSLHFKDIEAPSGNTEQHDTIWGTGVCNVAEMLQILKTSNFKGLMSVEYENNWYNSVPDIAKCVKYMEQNISK